jgi:hypothetical protein
MIGYEDMTKQPSALAESPYEASEFQGVAEVFDPSRADHSALHAGDLSGHPTSPADVNGALVKFGGELPDSAEALIGKQPVDVPSEPADVQGVIARYSGQSTPDKLPPSGSRLFQSAKIGVAVLGASLVAYKALPSPANPNRVGTPTQQVDRGVNKATIAAANSERIALGQPAIHFISGNPDSSKSK